MNVSHYGAFLYSSSFFCFLKKLRGIVIVKPKLLNQLLNQLQPKLPSQLLQLHRQLLYRGMILNHLQLHRHYKVSDGRTHSYFFLNLLAIFCKLTRLGSSTSSTSSGSIW